MRQPGEPSVDEILDSIKKVIARDSRADVAGPRRSRSDRDDAAPRRQRDDVLDLTLSEQFLDSDEDELGHDVDQGAEPPLVRPQARAAMRESLAALSMLSQPGAAPQIVRSGETSLEGLVRELLRPALADWLDQHLPEMVEGLVAAEIARIVGKKG